MINRQTKALFFDMDGTLADSLAVLEQVYYLFLQSHGFVGSKAEFDSLNGPPLDQVVAILKEKYDLVGSTEQLFDQYMSLVADLYPGQARLVPGAREAFRFAREQGFTIGIVSSAPEQLIKGFLSTNRLQVDFVIPREATVAGKPAPDPYLAALRQTGLRPDQAAAVEDSPAGVASARAAGLAVFRISANGPIEEQVGVRWISHLSQIASRSAHQGNKNIIWPIDDEIKVVINRQVHSGPSQKPSRLIDEIWSEEQLSAAGRSGGLFNGQLFCVDNFTTDMMVGYFADYKELVAQIRQPELFDSLGLTPLGVCGFLMCQGKLLLGKRGDQVTHYPGWWELAPSGGVDDDFIGSDDSVDIIAQFGQEFEEEIGLPADALINLRQRALILDQKTGVYDLCIGGECLCDVEQLLSTHRQNGSKEYSELALIEPDRMDQWLTGQAADLLPPSEALIRRLGPES